MATMKTEYLLKDEIICSECGCKCIPVEETWEYQGTHCNYGRKGTHHSGHYVSDCCGAEIKT